MIADTYLEVLKQHLLKESLLAGKIPSLGTIDDTLNSLSDVYPDQTKSWLGNLLTDLLAKEHSSSDLESFNKLLQTSQLDLNVLQTQCLNQARQEAYLTDRNLQEMDMLLSRLNEIEHDLNCRLLINRDSIGYVTFITENFANNSQVDTNLSSVIVDLAAHCIRIGHDTNTLKRLSTKDLDASACDVVSRNRIGLLSTTLNLDNLSSIFQDSVGSWRCLLRYSMPVTEAGIDLIIRISDHSLEFNRLYLLGHSDGLTPLTCAIAYSVDNLNFNNFDTVPVERVIGQAADYLFPSTTCQWIRLRFTKTQYDYQEGNSYVYEIGLRQLLLYSQQYSTGGEFYSKKQSAYNLEGQIIPFNQVALEVCESLPAETDINYSLSFDDGNNFIAITPLGREEANSPSVLYVGGSTEQELSGLRPNMDITTIYQGQNPLMQVDNDILLGTIVTGSNITELWRNVGTRGNHIAVRDGLSGWEQSGDYYSCAVKINANSVLVFNLGSTQMEVDGVLYSGLVTLKAGSHKIKTHKNNWAALTSNGQVLSYFSQVNEGTNGTFQVKDINGQTITAKDSLFPYNHRYLIEGLPYTYSTDATTKITYIGTDLFAARILRQVSLFDFHYNTDRDNYGVYALVTVNSETYILVKYTPTSGYSQDNYSLESFTLMKTQTENTVDSVIFKAELSSSNNISPQLYSYLIKLA